MADGREKMGGWIKERRYSDSPRSMRRQEMEPGQRTLAFPGHGRIGVRPSLGKAARCLTDLSPKASPIGSSPH